MKSYKIAVIPGDGIGKEVVPEGIRVLDAAAGKFGLAFDWQHFDWSCQLYTQTGRMMPRGWPRATRDIGGNALTVDLGKAIANAI
jgi:tartrate dehydrogenase/decarboxylase / D-malate dehydrogenase